MRVRFSTRELRFVKENDVCRISTIARDGWPHVVPVGYLYRNGRFYIPANKNSKKVKNLRWNSRASIVIDDDEENVLMVQGRVEIVEKERFSKLGRWMTGAKGWTMGDESAGAVLVLTPERKAWHST